MFPYFYSVELIYKMIICVLIFCLEANKCCYAILDYLFFKVWRTLAIIFICTLRTYECIYISFGGTENNIHKHIERRGLLSIIWIALVIVVVASMLTIEASYIKTIYLRIKDSSIRANGFILNRRHFFVHEWNLIEDTFTEISCVHKQFF